MKIVVQPEARSDILRQVTYLLKEFAFDAAERFPDAVREATTMLGAQPDIGSPQSSANRRLEGLRAWPVPGFEDVRLFYLHDGATLHVIRVLHGRQDIRTILRDEVG